MQSAARTASHRMKDQCDELSRAVSSQSLHIFYGTHAGQRGGWSAALAERSLLLRAVPFGKVGLMIVRRSQGSGWDHHPGRISHPCNLGRLACQGPGYLRETPHGCPPTTLAKLQGYYPNVQISMKGGYHLQGMKGANELNIVGSLASFQVSESEALNEDV